MKPPGVRPSACLCPIGHQQQRRPASLLLSAGVCNGCRLIAAAAVLQAGAGTQQQMRVASCWEPTYRRLSTGLYWKKVVTSTLSSRCSMISFSKSVSFSFSLVIFSWTVVDYSNNSTFCIITPPSPPLIVERGTVMTVSVSLSVCMSVRASISPEIHVRSSPTFLCVLPEAVARSFSSGVATTYVLPVIWMTSSLHVMARNRRRNSDSIRNSMDLTPWHILKLTHQGAAPDRGVVWHLRLPCYYSRKHYT